MTTPADLLQNRFVKSEPAMATAIAGAVVSTILAILSTHGVITHGVASTATQAVEPPVAAALMLVFGFVVRTLVAPAAKFTDRVQAEVQTRVNALTVTNSVPDPASTTFVSGTAAPRPSPSPAPDQAPVEAAAPEQVPAPVEAAPTEAAPSDSVDVAAALAAADTVYPATPTEAPTAPVATV